MATHVEEEIPPKSTVTCLEDGQEKATTGVIEAPVARTAEDKSLVFKQDLRIVPLCAGIYLLCYLDRSNIGERPLSLFSDPLLTEKAMPKH